MKVVIPAAGAAQRFKERGFKDPKPLIEVDGKPLIKWASDSLDFSHPKDFIFLVCQEHIEKFKIDQRLKKIYSDEITIVPVKKLTEGAACTVLLAEQYINNNEPLILLNCDLTFKAPLEKTIEECFKDDTDAFLITFESDSPRYSFARVDGKSGLVVEVAEKKPISNTATVGCYFFKRGSDFVAGAKEMIRKNLRVNNEFYVVPVYNELVKKDLKIRAIPCEWVINMGTPDELEAFTKGRTNQPI